MTNRRKGLAVGKQMPTAMTQNEKGEWVPAKPIGGKVRHWHWLQRIVDRLWRVKT